MPRDPSGTYTAPSNSFNPAVNDTVIEPADWNATLADLSSAMTDSLSRTAQGGMSADLDMNNNDINEIKTAVFQGSTSGTTTMIATAIAGTTTLTLPAATDTLVGQTTTDTLTNKTLTTPIISPSATIAMGADNATGLSISGAGANGRLSMGSTAGAVPFIRAQNGAALNFGINATDTAFLESGGLWGLGIAGSVVGRLKLYGNTSGSVIVTAPATASGTLTLPAATDTLVGKATADTFTNKTFDTAGTGNSFSINGVAVTANTGTGAVARAAAPIFTTPTLGSAVATNLTFSPTTGGIVGTTTSDNANAGVVGEYVQSDIVSGSAVALTTGVAANITSISLTAGDWDLSIAGNFTGGATTTLQALTISASSTSATLDLANGRVASQGYSGTASMVVSDIRFTLGPARISLSATTTVFFVARATFAVSTCSGYGLIHARRVR